jgi:flagellin
MSSILTNASAMVALQTLKSINSNLNMTQNEISTGKSVGSAKDNSAVWAISKVMESDVQGFKAISDSLSLGGSSIAVARSAAETVTDLLTKIKGKVVAAQEENVDRTKIQDDITALTNQIKSVTGAAQFNGLNLVKGQADVNVLSSLDRSSDGSVKSSQITVARQDLTSDAGSYNAAGTAITGTATASAAAAVDTAITEILTVAGTIAINDKFDFKIGDKTVSFTAATTTAADVASGLTAAINAAGIEGITAAVTGAAITLSSTIAFDDTALTFTTTGSGTGTYTGDAAIEARAETVTFSATAGVNEGDGYRVAIGGTNYDYIAGKGETFEDVARGLKTAIDAAGSATIATEVGKNSAGAWQLKVDNSSTTLAFSVAARAGGTATGGLFGLDSIDVTSTTKAAAALSNIETMIGGAINAAASLGSAQGRIETQSSFVSKLSDSLKIGIGSMVDANLEEASARLQALQVQQQLATQSLSIANQAPQSILSLFR